MHAYLTFFIYLFIFILFYFLFIFFRSCSYIVFISSPEHNVLGVNMKYLNIFKYVNMNKICAGT